MFFISAGFVIGGDCQQKGLANNQSVGLTMRLPEVEERRIADLSWGGCHPMACDSWWLRGSFGGVFAGFLIGQS